MRTPSLSQNTRHNFAGECNLVEFDCRGAEVVCFHAVLCSLVSWSKWWAQVSSMVTYLQRNCWICFIQTEIFKRSCQTDLFLFKRQHSWHPLSTDLVITQYICNDDALCRMISSDNQLNIWHSVADLSLSCPEHVECCHLLVFSRQSTSLKFSKPSVDGS